MSEAIIKFNNVGEKFRLYHQKNKDLKDRLFDFIKGRRFPKEEFWALKGVSFEIQHGEVVGIIGENGSGKTTILNLIASILKPDEGEIKIQGRVSALLELGTGFHPELSGRENIYLYGAVLGLSKKTIDSKLNEIIRFAELEKFIDAPVKTYSTGMYVRLGFAVAINVDPDILLIDEVLSVGDEAYQRKCIKEIEEFKRRGKTIIFVSHNMSLVSRICNRVIFLREGRVISDSPVDEGINLYMQTVGEKKGIALLKKGPLDLIFNHGKLLLCWEKKLLSSGLGSYTAFAIANNWYDSTQAEWEIIAKEEDKIVLSGRWPSLPLRQIWQISLTDSYDIGWEVAMKIEGKLCIDRRQISLRLSDKYKDWITSYEEGKFFDSFIAGRQENIHLQVKSIRVLGVKGTKDTQYPLPNVLFDFSGVNTDFTPSILNIDTAASFRVLQLQSMESIEPSSGEETCNFFYGNIIILPEEKDLKKYLKDRLIGHSLQDGPLKLFFEDGSVKLFWEGKELTRDIGLYSAFFHANKWYESRQINWQIQKVNSNQLLATNKWAELSLIQNWLIELKEKIIYLKIWIQVDREIVIDRYQVGMVLSERYTHWLCGQEKGEFKTALIDKTDLGFQDIINKKGPHLIGVKSSPAHLLPPEIPDIVFTTFNTNENIFSIVQGMINSELRQIRFCQLNLGEEAYLSSGTQPIFEGKISLELPEKQIQKVPINELLKRTPKKLKDRLTPYYCEKGNLSVSFEKGRVRLFWQGVELTKGMGMYTSLRSQGVWNESFSDTAWEVKNITQAKIIAQGQWKKLPLSQIWEIEILDENTIFWKVDMQIIESFYFEREQTNIMLSHRYKEWWVNNKETGKFPSSFNKDYYGDWESVWKGETKFTPIGVSAVKGEIHHLPTVAFDCSRQKDRHLANIVNSDDVWQARVLQCLRVNSGERSNFSPCKYNYFSGKIKINSL